MTYSKALAEMLEAEEIQRDEALRRIVAMVKRYEFTPTELLAIFTDVQTKQTHENCDDPSVKSFNPLFDVW